MDDVVIRSMARWPDVPAVFGWLALDARGNWLLRHPALERFERIANAALRDFIGRNYAADARGRWYFQNGPQRVYVRLHRTPFVYRFDGEWADHCGCPAGRVVAAWLDEGGTMILEADRGIGVVDDRDLERVARELLEMPHERSMESRAGEIVGLLRPAAAAGTAKGIPIGRILSEILPQRFGFDPEPRP